MIPPQLETDIHGVEVAGMFFFEDNNYALVKGDPIGERLVKVAKKKGMLLMGCDQCCYECEIDKKLVEGAVIGCFPNLYGMPDHIITLSAKALCSSTGKSVMILSSGHAPNNYGQLS